MINRITNIFIGLALFVSSFQASEIDSLRTQILNQGFSDVTIEKYSSYLLNSNFDTDIESDFLENIDESIFKDISVSIIEMKKGNYKKAIEIIIVRLQSVPKLFIYYDILFDLTLINDYKEILHKKILDFPENEFKNYLLGRLSYQNTEYKKAKTYFLNALSKTNKSFEINYWLSYCYRKTGDYDKGVKILNNELKRSKNKNQIASILNAKGSIHYLQGDYSRAKGLYKKAYQIAEKYSLTQEQIKSEMNMALIDDLYGEITAARKKLTNALSDANKIENIKLKAMVLSELGVSYSYTNELLKAKNNYLKSVELYSRLSDYSRLAILKYNIGLVYLGINNFGQAEKNFNQGLKYSGEDVRSKINNYTGLGDLEVNRSNYAKALFYFEKAKSLAKKIKEYATEIEIDISIGVLHFNLDQNQKSLEIFKGIIANNKMNNFPYLSADLYQKLALNYFELGELDSAENYFEKSINLAKKNQDILTELNTKTHFGKLLINQRKLKEAEKIIKYVFNISEEYELNQLAGLQAINLAEIELINNNLNEAKTYLIKAYNYSQNANDIETLIEINYRLSKIALADNKPEIAEKYLIDAIKLIDKSVYKQYKKESVQIPYFAKYQEVYEYYINLKLKDKKYIESLVLYDNYRARNTNQKLIVNKIHNTIDNNQEAELLLDKIWEFYSGNEIEKEYLKKISQILNINEVKDFSFVQKLLNENENIISIYTDGEKTFAFIINKSEIETKIINISEKEINKLVAEISPIYDNKINNKINFNQDLFAFNSDKSFKLYNKLFKPVLENISKNSSLIFVLPECLLSLPVEFLITSKSESGSAFKYSDKEFLINKHNISYAPSISSYEKLQNLSNSESANLLLVGNPLFGSKEYYTNIRSTNPGNKFLSDIEIPQLKYSEEEVEKIESQFDNSLVLLNDKATESNVKKYLSNSSVIHLSTHSYIDKNTPIILFSSLNDKKNDGILERGELIESRINSDLIVLSSCRSGLGNIDKAEGILGMQKSFFDAGGKSIIVSLWDVNDQYTSVFMELFYTYLGEGNNKSESLRYAKKDFIKNYSANPYFWAGFVLSGNTKPLDLVKKSPNYYIMIIIICTVLLAVLLGYLKKFKKNKI